MGVLSDFVIAPPEAAPQIGESIRTSEEWKTLEGWKGIETIKLSTLYCSITGENYSNKLMQSFKLLGGNKEDGPWVFIFPNKVTDAIASLSKERYKEVAKLWVQTDELKMDGWKLQDAELFISQIVEYAKISKLSNKSLFLWFSL
jgi:hypothetical protein